MCGVFGWIGNADDWPAAHALLRELAIAHEVRGEHAAGWAALTRRGELLWRRRPGRARALFCAEEFQALRRRRIIMAIGHTRHATSGAPARNGNNHPHLAGDWALVHNGVVAEHRVVAAAHGLRLTSKCDSEVLARLLDLYGEQRGPAVCLGLAGGQSVIAINRASRHLVAWTNGIMPLVAFRVGGIGGIWWASTRELAERALGRVELSARFAQVQPGRVYRMWVEAGEVRAESRHVGAGAARLGEDSS